MAAEMDSHAAGQNVFVRILKRLLVPILSILLTLVLGGIVIALSHHDPVAAFGGLWEGAFGKEDSLIETLIQTTPYIFAGLAVAVGFRGGLFNIGVEGQLFVGSIFAVIVGYSIELPPPLHVIVALGAGALGGALWAGIPGLLKAKTGAHEVITTIMTNYIALGLINWAISSGGPLRMPRSPLPETRRIFETARLPEILPDLHVGVLLAVGTAFLIYWLIWRTPFGFEVRTVGLSHSAARYAGVNVERTVVLTMCLSGALAGLGGAVQVLGLTGYFTTGFNVGLGFDSIAVAMLGGNHPVGIVGSALLFGILDAGAATMQLRSQTPRTIITIIQGLLLLFAAAPLLVRQLFRLPQPEAGEEAEVSISAKWGGEG
jgi:simple sugar transport system permease protein